MPSFADFYTWTAVKASATTTELSSYAMPKHYEGGLDTVGDGELNWRGEPICANQGGSAGSSFILLVCNTTVAHLTNVISRIRS